MNKLSEAFGLAVKLHHGQTRKGTAIPYTSHLMSVSALVLEHGGDEDQAIAGLLHDALEDCGPEHAQTIKDRFGDRVLRIVESCTDGVPDGNGHKPDWRARKEAYIAHLKDGPEESLLVSACDKLHNARAILMDLRTIGPAVFQRFKAGKDGTIWYYSCLSTIFLDRIPGALADEIARTVNLIEAEAAQ
ncbi:MAG: HD domain-containing protein [Candidatus Obscuribacter sp.]|nr:HD domain-containing protein [Candidatus Obscuribacter sp.]